MTAKTLRQSCYGSIYKTYLDTVLDNITENKECMAPLLPCSSNW